MDGCSACIHRRCVIPYKSDKQRRYFNANRAQLESEGVDVGHWNDETRGKKLPKKIKKKKAESWRYPYKPAPVTQNRIPDIDGADTMHQDGTGYAAGAKAASLIVKKSDQGFGALIPSDAANHLQSGLGGSLGMGVLGAGAGGILGAAAGGGRGNIPEGIGRGVFRGGATGLGAGLGGLGGSLAGRMVGLDPKLQLILGLLGGGAGGAAGYFGSGALMGPPESKREEEKQGYALGKLVRKQAMGNMGAAGGAMTADMHGGGDGNTGSLPGGDFAGGPQQGNPGVGGAGIQTAPSYSHSAAVSPQGMAMAY